MLKSLLEEEGERKEEEKEKKTKEIQSNNKMAVNTYLSIITLETLGQDVGIGKHNSSSHTTISILQLKYKTNITQNHQKSS